MPPAAPLPLVGAMAAPIAAPLLGGMAAPMAAPPLGAPLAAPLAALSGDPAAALLGKAAPRAKGAQAADMISVGKACKNSALVCDAGDKRICPKADGCLILDAKGLVEKAEKDICKCPEEPENVYYVDDQKAGMAVIGALAGVSIIPGTPLCAGGVALVALLEGEVNSHRQVVGIQNANEVHALKRPKKSKDLEKWLVGDRLQYTLGLGAMLPVGIGAIAAGAGVVPLIQARWRVRVEKVAPTTMEVEFVKEKDYGVRYGVGTIVINSSKSHLKIKEHENTYRVDVSTDEGLAQFEDLMRYRHMFEGGIKKYDDLKEEGELQFVTLTESGEIKTQVVDRNKLRVIIPFLFNYASGKKLDKIKAMITDYQQDADGDCVNPQYCERKTIYRMLRAPNNFFKKKYRRNFFRQRQNNGVTQGIVALKNGQMSVMAEARLSISNNHLKDRHYRAAMKRIDEYIDLRKPISQNILWPDDVKREGSLIVSISLKVDNDGMRRLIAAREKLVPYLFDNKDLFNGFPDEFEKAEKSLKAITHLLTELNLELYGKDDINHRRASGLLRKVVNKIRKELYVIRTIETIEPGVLQVVLQVSATNIPSMTKIIDLN